MPETQDVWRKVWGSATAALHRARAFSWVDLLVVVGLAGILFAVFDLASEWTAPHRATVEINPSPWALPGYTLISLARGLIAYCISLVFTLLYGYWAAKDRLAGRVLIPLLDILQSIPVLAFLPGLLFALSALFPRNNVGLELAAVLLIFTGQAWNMTFSYYHSLRSVPQDQQDCATAYRFTWWQRLKWVELPYSTMGLVWNSMMSMAGGWFFLMICETYRLGDDDFRRPGLGSYMQTCIRGRTVRLRGVGVARHAADDCRARSTAVAAGGGVVAKVSRRRRGRPNRDVVVVFELAQALAHHRVRLQNGSPDFFAEKRRRRQSDDHRRSNNLRLRPAGGVRSLRLRPLQFCWRCCPMAAGNWFCCCGKFAWTNGATPWWRES